MPLALRDVNTVIPDMRIKRKTLYLDTGLIIEHHIDSPTQQHVRLRGMQMLMDRQNRPRLQRIQQPLHLGIQRIMQIEIHPQPLRDLRRGRYLVQKFVVYESLYDL